MKHGEVDKIQSILVIIKSMLKNSTPMQQTRLLRRRPLKKIPSVTGGIAAFIKAIDAADIAVRNDRRVDDIDMVLLPAYAVFKIADDIDIGGDLLMQFKLHCEVLLDTLEQDATVVKLVDSLRVEPVVRLLLAIKLFLEVLK